MSTKRPLSPTQLSGSTSSPPHKKPAPAEPTTTIFRNSDTPMVVPVSDSSTHEPATTTMPTIAAGWRIIFDYDNNKWTLDPSSVASFNGDDILDILHALGYTYRKSCGYHHPAMGPVANMKTWGENFAHEDGLRKFMCRRGVPGVPANPDWDALLGIEEDEEEDGKQQAQKSGDQVFYNSNDGSQKDDDDEDPPQLSLHKWVALANAPLLERTVRSLLPQISIPSNEQAIQWLFRDYGFQVDTDSGNLFRYRIRDGGVDYFANVEQLRRRVQCMDETELLEQPHHAAEAGNEHADTPGSPEPSRRTSRRRRTPAKTQIPTGSAKKGRRRLQDDQENSDATTDRNNQEHQLLALRLWAALTPAPIPVFGDEHAELPMLPTLAIPLAAARAAVPAVASLPAADTTVDDYYFDTHNNPPRNVETFAVPRLSDLFNRKKPATPSAGQAEPSKKGGDQNEESKIHTLQNRLFLSVYQNDPEEDKPLSEAVPMGCIIL